MAFLIRNNKIWTIVLTDRAGERRYVSLGVSDEKQARMLDRRVMGLIEPYELGLPPEESAVQWAIEKAPRKIYDGLARLGLIPKRQHVNLKAFLDANIEVRKATLKPGTIRNLKQVAAYAVAYFGADRALGSITPSDVEKFRAHLVNQPKKIGRGADKENPHKLAPATVDMIMSKTRDFFTEMVKAHLIHTSPFKGVKLTHRINPDRLTYVDKQTVLKVMDLCPNPESRLCVALVRFAGLRFPSEAKALKWTDIDWDAGMMTIHSPKTAHHEGQGTRQTPIFWDLEKWLREAREAAPEGAVHVITHYRGENMRTVVNRIIRKAGILPWAKTFHNLRASCQMDLIHEYPESTVCAWLGNKSKVARRHYLKPTKADIEKATGKPQTKPQTESVGS